MIRDKQNAIKQAKILHAIRMILVESKFKHKILYQLGQVGRPTPCRRQGSNLDKRIAFGEKFKRISSSPLCFPKIFEKNNNRKIFPVMFFKLKMRSFSTNFSSGEFFSRRFQGFQYLSVSLFCYKPIPHPLPIYVLYRLFADCNTSTIICEYGKDRTWFDLNRSRGYSYNSGWLFQIYRLPFANFYHGRWNLQQ